MSHFSRNTLWCLTFPHSRQHTSHHKLLLCNSGQRSWHPPFKALLLKLIACRCTVLQTTFKFTSIKQFSPSRISGSISSSSPTSGPADVLIQALPPHRRARSAAWSYHFYPEEAWIDLTICLPCAVLLKEVQIQPHLTSLASKCRSCSRGFTIFFNVV